MPMADPFIIGRLFRGGARIGIFIRVIVSLHRLDRLGWRHDHLFDLFWRVLHSVRVHLIACGFIQVKELLERDAQLRSRVGLLVADGDLLGGAIFQKLLFVKAEALMEHEQDGEGRGNLAFMGYPICGAPVAVLLRVYLHEFANLLVLIRVLELPLLVEDLQVFGFTGAAADVALAVQDVEARQEFTQNGRYFQQACDGPPARCQDDARGIGFLEHFSAREGIVAEVPL